MEKKGGASFDPGWNDPPMFSYDAQAAQSKVSKPKTILNKRVGFPLHGASPPSSNSFCKDPTAPLPTYDASSVPPPPCVSQSPKRDSFHQKNATVVDDAFDPAQALGIVMKNFTEILDKKLKNEDKDRSEIQRRLEAMKKMWLENSLCQDIQQRLLKLSEALLVEEIDKADDLQKGLMVDHASMCSQWMSGIRHLIHHNEYQRDSQNEDNRQLEIAEEELREENQ